MRKKKRLNRWTTFDTVVTILALAAVAVTLFPMLYVAACSISDPKMVLAGKVTLIPRGFSTDAYSIVISNMDFWRGFRNSILYVVVGCLLMLFTTVAISYPLTRQNLKFRKLLTYYLLIPMYFSGGKIPAFIVITKVGLYNSPLALVLPGCYSIGNIILCRTFMASLPGELIDSALIDGSDQFRTFLKIVLPLSKPVLAVIMIYTIVGVWNAWFEASIYTTNKAIQPVQLYVRNILASTANMFQNQVISQMPMEMQKKYQEMALSANQIKYAMIVITTAPIIAVYPMFQKHFTKGIMLGSLKG